MKNSNIFLLSGIISVLIYQYKRDWNDYFFESDPLEFILGSFSWFILIKIVFYFYSKRGEKNAIVR